MVPLSFKNVDAAKNLLNAVFPVQTRIERSDFWLPASLDGIYKRKSPNNKVVWVKYWVALEQKKVIGITGLYTLKDDEAEAYWLSWFCVDPVYRQKGIGNRLLDFAIRKAKAGSKRFLRLYTSPDDPNETAAQVLYEKKGFGITGIDGKRGKYAIAYRELKLD